MNNIGLIISPPNSVAFRDKGNTSDALLFLIDKLVAIVALNDNIVFYFYQ